MVGYWSLIDAADAVAGHGTHVAGSVAGEAACSRLARYNGMAPAAKLLFTDLECNTPGGCSCGTKVWCPCKDKKDHVCSEDDYLHPPEDLNHG